MSTSKLFTCAAFSLFLIVNPSWSELTDTQSRPTFYKNVLPILQENCQACHRPRGLNLGGMVAPFPLTTYKAARPWAKAIAKQVAARTMPPWHASKIHNDQFANERTLTDDEIATLVRWVELGAPQGKPSDAPEPLKFPDSDWSFGEPDLIVAMPDRFFIEDDVDDLYVNFQGKIDEALLDGARWAGAMEVKPGSEAVHHVVSSLGGLTPGMEPNVYREGFGQYLKPGQAVHWEIHYNKEPGPGTGLWDQTQIGFLLHPKEWKPKYRSQAAVMGNYTFKIPAGDPNFLIKADDYTFAKDARIMSYFPHMHLRGQEMKMTAFYPDGSDEIIMHIPKYDFNWQTVYKYEEFKFMPKGTRLELVAWYDNSANNPSNPDPTTEVEGPKYLGAPMRTIDEMMYTLFTFTDSLPKSEKVATDGADD